MWMNNWAAEFADALFLQAFGHKYFVWWNG
jgi:hypothetical protein